MQSRANKKLTLQYTDNSTTLIQRTSSCIAMPNQQFAASPKCELLARFPGKGTATEHPVAECNAVRAEADTMRHCCKSIQRNVNRLTGSASFFCSRGTEDSRTVPTNDGPTCCCGGWKGEAPRLAKARGDPLLSRLTGGEEARTPLPTGKALTNC